MPCPYCPSAIPRYGTDEGWWCIGCTRTEPWWEIRLRADARRSGLAPWQVVHLEERLDVPSVRRRVQAAIAIGMEPKRATAAVTGIHLDDESVEERRESAS